eukprot:8244391-Ditylum_brightwellii.AAC.1
MSICSEDCAVKKMKPYPTLLAGVNNWLAPNTESNTVRYASTSTGASCKTTMYLSFPIGSGTNQSQQCSSPIKC